METTMNTNTNILDLDISVSAIVAPKAKGECVKRLVEEAGADRLALMRAAQMVLAEAGAAAIELRLDKDKAKSKALKEHLKALRAAAAVALETHDRACGAGFWNRQAARAETLRRLEARELGRANAKEMASAFAPVMDEALTRLAVTFAECVEALQEAKKEV